MVPILHHAGLGATFRLLTTGALPEDSVEGYGETLLRSRPTVLDDETLLARFKAAEVPSSPYAYAIDPSGETVLPLIEADPLANSPQSEILPDGDWVSLQQICAG